MPVYDRFASIYQRGPYLRFSQNIAETVLPQYLKEMGIKPTGILDIACGEGSFAVEMSKQGYHVTGTDRSYQMIDLAKKRAFENDQPVKFIVEDMRSLPFEADFDLVTCFFDSLNYLLTIKDLNDTFLNVYRALRPGGTFIFDMNTIYGLAVDWMRQETYIQNEGEDFMEIHRHEFDYENQIATVEITVFQKQEKFWDRFDETHRERGYPIADLQFLLLEAGFEITGIYGNISKQSEVRSNSPRVWFSALKP